jgi:hypothetical protein
VVAARSKKNTGKTTGKTDKATDGAAFDDGPIEIC